MSTHEPERPTREGTLPVPVGDETVTYRGRMIEIVTQQMRADSREIVYEQQAKDDIVALMKLISQAVTQ